MSAAAPWSVKGIEPKAREIAKDLARRSGMTLGEWLNTMILDDEDDGVTPLPRRPHAAEAFDRRARSRRLDDAYDPSGWDSRATGFDRRRDEGRDPARDEVLHRVAASVDAIAARLEAAERRSTAAIQGVDQAVAGLLRRLDGQDAQHEQHGQRIDDIADELREGTTRLRAFEKEVGPRTAEGFVKTETAIAAVTSRLYDIEERQRLGGIELRQRMDVAEQAVHQAPKGAAAAEVMAQVSARLDQAQAQTAEALRGLERSFAGLDQRLHSAEARVEPEGVREAARFEKMAETLSRQVEAGRSEMMRRLDTVETDGRLERIERAMAVIEARADTAEKRSAEAVDAMGREVLRVAENFNGRLALVESRPGGAGSDDLEAMGRALATDLSARVERETARHALGIEQRLNRADDQHAIALEKLGGEIARISDRLTDRITQSERKAAQAMEDIGRRLTDSADRAEQRVDRLSGEMGERMRLSEERTSRLLTEARDRLEQRVQPVEGVGPVAPPRAVTPTFEPAPSREGDWRAAAFPTDAFGPADDGWSREPLTPQIPAPEIAPVVLETAPPPEPDRPAAPVNERSEAVAPERRPEAGTGPFGAATAFGGFGGADVGDALEATAPERAVDAEDDDFDGETDFVDARALRASMAAASAAGRAASTRTTIDAARAAMNVAPVEEPKPGFSLGFKRGGKSRLQERLDKQATRDGSTVRKALLASVISAAAIAGVISTLRLTGVEVGAPDGGAAHGEVGTTTLASLTLTPIDVVAPAVPPEAETLYETGVERLDAGDEAGLEPLIEAAGLGHAPAQLKLVGLYQTGEAGVPQDDTESRLWARRAAEGGDPRGMHAFGMYLYDGVGGGQNRPEALRWLVRAADLGLIDSQFNAAKIYEIGDEGIAPNPAEAFTWYLIAARAGDAQAQAAVDRLTPTVPAAARRTARAAASAFRVEATG